MINPDGELFKGKENSPPISRLRGAVRLQGKDPYSEDRRAALGVGVTE